MAERGADPVVPSPCRKSRFVFFLVISSESVSVSVCWSPGWQGGKHPRQANHTQQPLMEQMPLTSFCSVITSCQKKRKEKKLSEGK